MTNWRTFDPDDPKWEGILIKWIPTKEELNPMVDSLRQTIDDMLLKELCEKSIKT